MPRIITSPAVPDSTYFRMDDAAPFVDGAGDLVVLNGKGTARKSWGAPAVTSTIYLHEAGLCAVHIAFHHKHGGDQGWRYFRETETGWCAVERFTSLSKDERARVACAWMLALAQGKVAKWMTAPSKRIAVYLPA